MYRITDDFYSVTPIQMKRNVVKSTYKQEVRMIPIRMGTGYDVHQLTKGRKLILGGVEIEHTLGLLGHSDADVLVHAIMDAMLGALALGDIGKWFPDTDEKYRGCSSIWLLNQVGHLIKEHGYRVGNMDAVIIAQAPKCAPYIEKMRQNIAETLGLELDQVSVKATTEEKLGFTGRQEGIASQAVVSLYHNKLKSGIIK